MRHRGRIVMTVALVIIAAGSSCERRTEVDKAMDRVEKKVEQQSQ